MKSSPLCHQVADGSRWSRREWLARTGNGFGALALGHLLMREGGRSSQVLANEARIEATATTNSADTPFLTAPHVIPQAKRVIYLFQSGGPSQLETFDYKPLLSERFGEALPDSVRKGQRLTGMSANQSSLAMVGSKFGFRQHGQAGAWISDLLPHTAKIADDLCIVKSIYTEAINHDPAITFLQTGSQIAGRPSIGSWLNYGLGSDNENLPAFVVLITRGKTDQPLYSRLWGAGFLPSRHQGVQFRSGSDAVLYLNNPPGISRDHRRAALETLAQLQLERQQETHDPELSQRIAQYEMAFRMQASVPEATDLSGEPEHIYEMYGSDSKKPGTFAANCLLARRLAERGVKFIQLYHQGWDQHGGLPGGITQQCKETDQASAALVADLKQRGLLDDTLVVWGGEFGRTSYSQGRPSPQNYGRDHHPRCFSMWFAGGGIKPGTVVGRTCDFGYNIEERPVHVHDLHATMLHLLGVDHERLTYRFQGRDFRLTDVHGHVVEEMLA